jgi:hypothetical protein
MTTTPAGTAFRSRSVLVTLLCDAAIFGIMGKDEEAVVGTVHRDVVEPYTPETLEGAALLHSVVGDKDAEIVAISGYGELETYVGDRMAILTKGETELDLTRFTFEAPVPKGTGLQLLIQTPVGRYAVEIPFTAVNNQYSRQGGLPTIHSLDNEGNIHLNTLDSEERQTQGWETVGIGFQANDILSTTDELMIAADGGLYFRHYEGSLRYVPSTTGIQVKKLICRQNDDGTFTYGFYGIKDGNPALYAVEDIDQANPTTRRLDIELPQDVRIMAILAGPSVTGFLAVTRNESGEYQNRHLVAPAPASAEA